MFRILPQITHSITVMPSSSGTLSFPVVPLVLISQKKKIGLLFGGCLLLQKVSKITIGLIFRKYHIFGKNTVVNLQMLSNDKDSFSFPFSI